MKKIIIWYKICSYLIGYFHNFFRQILTHSLLEAFLYLHIRDAGGDSLKADYLHITVAIGPLWKQGIYTLQLLLGTPFETRVLNNHCCWRPFSKQSTCTWQSMLLAPPKADCLRIATAFTGPFESRVPAYYSCYCGPLGSRAPNYKVLWKILYERIIRFSPKWGNSPPKHFRGPDASASLASP